MSERQEKAGDVFLEVLEADALTRDESGRKRARLRLGRVLFGHCFAARETRKSAA